MLVHDCRLSTSGWGRCLRWASLALAALLVTACTDAPTTALRFGLSSSPVTLDPRFATDATSTRINRLLYQQLVDFNERFEPIPALATWERVSPRRYRFTLTAPSASFHEGSPVTAGDVKATYDSVLDADTGSPHRGVLDMVERVDAVDDRTVEFQLSREDPLFPGRLVVGLMPARLIEAGHPFHDHPVGSGGFAFLDWPSEGRLRLRRRSDGQIVEFIRVAEPTVRVLKLLRDELDMLQGDLPPELVAWLEERSDVRVDTASGTNFTYLGFNLQDPVVGKLAVRRAVAHAVDREAIIRHVLGGAARPADALLPPDHWAGNPGLVSYPHDPDKARALLRSVSHGDGHPLRLVYKTSSDPFRIRLATIIQHQLGQVGLDLEIRSYDWGTFYGDIKAGRFQLYSLSWVGLKMPDIFRYIFHSTSLPPAGANRGRFASSTVDALIERAEAGDSRAEQTALYREVQARLLESLPYVPLWYEGNVLVTRAGIRGYPLAADGNFDGLMTVARPGKD